MTLRDYVLVLARNWLAVAVTVLVGLVGATGLALAAPTTYTASAQVLFTGHASTSGQDLAFVGSYVQSRMRTYRTLGASSTLLTSVAETLGSEETPDELDERTDIEVTQLDTVATVSASDATDRDAARTANTLAAGLVDAVERLENDQAAAVDDRPVNTTISGAITSEAVVPDSPSDPDWVFYLLAGALGGLAVSFGVVALREVLTGDSSAPAGTGAT